MFGKNKWFAIITLAILFMACDLEGGNKGDDGVIPLPPINVSASPQSSTDINVSWDKVSNADSYEVYYQTVSLPITRRATVKGTSYTDTGLQPNTTYNYYIKAKNNARTSDYSSRASATTHARNATN